MTNETYRIEWLDKDGYGWNSFFREGCDTLKGTMDMCYKEFRNLCYHDQQNVSFDVWQGDEIVAHISNEDLMDSIKEEE